MAMLLVRIRHRVMFSGIEQLALLVAHVARCLVNPGGMMQGEELDAASDIVSGSVVMTGHRMGPALDCT